MKRRVFSTFLASMFVCLSTVQVNAQLLQSRTASFATVASAVQGEQPRPAVDESFLLRRLYDIDFLPVLEDSHTGMESTWDRAGGNRDGTDFKKLIGNRNILLDVDGPGYISRIFTGVLGKKLEGTRIQVFLDNSATPIFDEEVNQFFDDKNGLFPYPLVFHKTYPGLLMPIPFSRHCLVQLVNDHPDEQDSKKNLDRWGNYWQVTYTTYPKGVEVRSLHWPLNGSEKKEMQALCKAWLRAEATPPPPLSHWSVNRTFALAPHQAKKLQLVGCGVLREMRVSITPNNPEMWRGIRLRIAWDGASFPSVDVPLGYFFGNAEYGNDPSAQFSSLTLGLTPSGPYSRFPMPYEKGAVLELVNETSLPASNVNVRLNVERRRSLPANWGRLHATWNEERAYGDDYTKLQRTGPMQVPVHTVFEASGGPGKYVGVLLHVHWPIAGKWWGEGDWQIWTDEHGWPPSYHGTGSEEYFNSGWCQFDRKAMSGYIVANENHFGDNTVYSIHLNDAFQFQKNIRVDVEIWPWVRGPVTDALWGSTAFWYALPAQPAASRQDLISRRELDQR